MPYIKDEVKNAMTDAIENMQALILSKGDLNYVICEIVSQLILSDEISYTKISEWIDGVHDAETELRRRLLESYEDLKKDQNGDVPGFIKILDRMR